MTEYNLVLPKDLKTVGKIVEIECKPDRVLIFQVPVPTRQMTVEYRAKAKDALKSFLPEGANYIMIGNDVDIYDVCQVDAVALILKGDPE